MKVLKRACLFQLMPAVEDIRPLVGGDRRKVNGTAEKIQEIVQPQMCSDLFLTLTADRSFLYDDGRPGIF